VAAALLAVAALGLVAVAARSGRTPSFSAVTTRTPAPTPTTTVTETAGPTPTTLSPTPAGGNGWVLPGTTFVIVALAALAYLIGFWAWLLHRSRGGRLTRRQLPRPGQAAATGEPDPMVAGELAGAVDAGLRRVAEGEPRDAIVACWVLLERAAADAGVERRPAETPSELTERVLAAHRVNPATLGRLADLYREARYSRHELGEPAREQARSALEHVRGELGQPVGT